MNIMQIQARLYWRIIRQNLDRDEYFKDFSLSNYRFIVVNNINNPVPLVWNFEQTQSYGSIQLGNNVFRDPETIGKELSFYLQTKPQVPINVTLYKSNSIEQWFEKQSINYEDGQSF